MPMKDYYLTIAGLRIALHTPYEITISDNLRPFLCRSHDETDCRITLRSCPQLPGFSENGIWRGPEYYDYHRENRRVFHCNAPQTAAFAMTQLLKNGDVELCILPDYLSYFTGTTGIFNRIGMETLLLQHQSLLLHASLIKYKGKTLAFAGPSGVGKSTQANIWHKFLGADVINGDRAALRKEQDSWYAYGSPYAGTSGIYKNDYGPLAGIILLQQAGENCLRQLSDGEAFRCFYPELSVHHWDEGFVTKATDLCLQLLAETPVYLLECRPEESAALLVKKGLNL